MAQPVNIRRVLFPVLFVLFSFGTGFLLVTASQQNTEDRSKAAGIDPYISPTQVSPTQAISPWDECVSWDTLSDDACVDTYRTYKAKRDADWRCKDLTNYLGLCPYVGIEFPSEPMP